MSVQMVGLIKSAAGTYAAQACGICGAYIVWAHDDRFPEKPDIGEFFNFHPLEVGKGKGAFVLWYEVTEKGKPTGKQQFRLLDPLSDYTGDTWALHLKTCGVIR
jgi:hypothetical protein